MAGWVSWESWELPVSWSISNAYIPSLKDKQLNFNVLSMVALSLVSRLCWEIVAQSTLGLHPIQVVLEVARLPESDVGLDPIVFSRRRSNTGTHFNLIEGSKNKLNCLLQNFHHLLWRSSVIWYVNVSSLLKFLDEHTSMFTDEH